MSEVLLGTLFGLVWRTSFSSIYIKNDTDYLHMRCAWAIRSFNIFQTSLGFVMGKHSWNIPWLSEQLAAVTKTFFTLAGFFCSPLQTLLPVEINKTWPLLKVTHTSQNIDLLKAAWPAICQAKALDIAVVLCCRHQCLHSFSLLLLPWMNTVGQWVLCLSVRKVMGKCSDGWGWPRKTFPCYFFLVEVEYKGMSLILMDSKSCLYDFFWPCSQIISNVGLSHSRVHHWMSPKLLTTLRIVPLPGGLLLQIFKCISI